MLEDLASLKSSSVRTKFNTSKEQIILNEFFSDKSITIKEADKRGNLIILDMFEYKKEVFTRLQFLH